MAAVLAIHHSREFEGILADKYGNDPFVWAQPFLWSHCHARSRPSDFGMGKKPPLVRGRDAVFFLTIHPKTRKLVCDCVFVIDKVLPIADAETQFPRHHPARHYHFDQQRNGHHTNSAVTRLGSKKLSFVLDPPMPIGSWVEAYVRRTGTPVSKYFRSKKIKNVRVVTRDASGLYNRILRWSRGKGHRAHNVLSIQSLLATMRPSYRASGPIILRRNDA
jgi:hypothetical protein